MPAFHVPTTQELQAFRSAFLSADRNSCEYCIGNVFVWKEHFHSQIALHDDMVFYKGGNRSVVYLFPVGSGDTEQALLALFADAKKNGKPFHLAALCEDDCRWFENNDLFCIRRTEDTDDFVYRASDLCELAGKKYHAKRNHISRFTTDYPDWKYEKLTADRIALCREISDAWFMEKHGSFDHPEYAVVQNTLNHFEDLGFEGGILFADGKAVAFTTGEPLTHNTFCTHLEKCHPDYRGAYPVINREFAKQLADRFEYINREDCAGDDGLRKAKMSYRPAFLTEKYSVYPTDLLYEKLGIHL